MASIIAIQFVILHTMKKTALSLSLAYNTCPNTVNEMNNHDPTQMFCCPLTHQESVVL